MSLKYRFILAFLIVFIAVNVRSNLHACGGTPVPVCNKAVFLAKFVPAVVVIPAAGPIVVPIGVLPFALWNVNPLCPQPAAASLSITLTCLPSGVVIGPLVFPMPVPVVPGAQPVPPVLFVIPAGTFPPGSPPQICAVAGTYTVTFDVPVSFTGDTEVCLVPPSPLDPTMPRLEMRYLDPDGLLYRTCRRGDQANVYFLLANNDPAYSVSLNLSSTGRQVAVLPDGYDPLTAYDFGVHAISYPEPGTDTYPAAFTDTLSPGQLLPEPDPFIPDPQLLTRDLTLQPGEATIIGITMRSYGMCANGSCNERLVKVSGTFSNGDSALACASTALLVDEVPPKTALCEFSDIIKVSDFGQALWSAATFFSGSDPIANAMTFYPGNLPPSAGFRAFQTIGQAIQNPPSPPSQAQDYLRVPQGPSRITYEVQAQLPPFVCPTPGPVFNHVTVKGWDQAAGSPTRNAFPLISFFQPFLDIEFDVSNDSLVISSSGTPLFQGLAAEFLSGPPPGFCVDPATCRIFNKIPNPSDKTITVLPPVKAKLFVENGSTDCDTFMVFNDQTGAPEQWFGSVNGSGPFFTSPSGVGEAEVCYDISGLPLFPATTISYLQFSCPGALDDPQVVPVAIRLLPPPSSEPLMSLTHTPGDLQVGIFNDGSIGAENVGFTGPGVSWKGQNGIFVGGPIFGTTAAGSVNGLIGSFLVFGDLANIGSNFAGGFTSEPGFNQVAEAKLNDSGAPTPYPVDIVQKSYSNTGDNFVFIRYGFVNNGAAPLADFFAGIFVDWDINAATFTTNRGGYALDERLVYQFDTGGTPYYYGVVVADGLAGYKTHTGGTTAIIRQESFTWISTPDPDPIGAAGDFRSWQGGGPENIAPGDTLWRTFAMVAGDDLAGIRANAAAALAKAEAQGWIPPSCTTGLLGDINGDNAVNSLDALLMLSFDAGLPLPQPFLDRIAIGFGDVTEDGLTNSTDALVTLSWEVGFPVPFPVGSVVCLPAPAPLGKSTLRPAAEGAEVQVYAGLNFSGQNLPRQGSYAEVPVMINMANAKEKLGSYTLSLSWNPALLEFSGFSGGTTEGFANPVVNDLNVKQGRLTAAHAYPQGAAGLVNVLNARFSVIGTPEALPGNPVTLNFSAMAAAQTFTDLLPAVKVVNALEDTPGSFALENYPNPFNPATEIRYQLPEAVEVQIVVYNVLGQKVQTLVNGKQPAGAYTVRWEGQNGQGQPVPSGMYFLRMKAGKFVADRKLLLLK